MVFRLIKYTVEGTRTRLDRIYLESLNNPANSSESVEEKNQEVTDLQEELESLYAEILPVAQMSAEQQYLEPALRGIASRNGQGQERSAKAMKYVCMSFLTMSLVLTSIDTRLPPFHRGPSRDLLRPCSRAPML